MIDGMRKFAKSKWAAVLLFFPLVIGLAMFVPDAFNGGSSGGVLTKVGSRQVTSSEVGLEIDRTIRRAMLEREEVMSQEDAVRNGTAERELLQVEYNKTLLAFADKVGIRASEEALKPYLERNKVLTNAFGKVDLAAIQQEAQDRRLSGREFEKYLLDFLTQRYIEVAAFSAVNVPDVLTQPFVKFYGETRTLSLARPSATTIADPTPPTEAEMQAWYDTNKEREFRQPERRRISVLSYSPDDFIDQAALTDEQVRAGYQERIKEYSTPETRDIVEFTSTDRGAVQAFIDLVMQGIAWEQALAQSPAVTKVERQVKPEQIQDEDYRTFVFSREVGKVNPNPIQLPNTEPFFTLLVKTITPGVPTPFEQIADRVRRDLAMPEAIKKYEESAEPFRDAAGGQPLEDIGRQFGIPVFNLAPVDAEGRAANGDQARMLVANRDAMRDLFTLSPGQMTTVYEGDSLRSMFRLDEVVAPSILPFAEAKDRVRGLMLRERALKALDTAVTAAVDAVKAGTPFDQAVKNAKLQGGPAITVMRDAGQQQQVDPAVVQAAFALKDGEVALVRGSGQEPWIARVDKIAAAEPQMAAMIQAQLGNQVSQSLQQDLSEVFQRGLQKEVDFKRDENAVRAFFEGMLPKDGLQ